MKSVYTLTAVFLILCMLLFPLIPAKKQNRTPETATLASLAVAAPDHENFRVLTSDGTVREFSVQDYLFGVVSAEMPASYQPEALKAQAVAAYTYALYKQDQNQKEPYDITADPGKDQAFYTREEAAAHFGDHPKECAEKIDSAIQSVLGRRILYENKPIFAAYTAISGGKTESSENAFGTPLPYLQPVESIGDLLCSDYLSTATFTPEELQPILSGLGVTGATESWFSDPQVSDSGTVLSMDFGGTRITGADLRSALGLRSADFSVSFADGTFTLSVRGYGHLCGMSQYGANYMALQGSDYREILSHYYTGCTVE